MNPQRKRLIKVPPSQLYAWGKWTSEQIGVEFDWPVNDQPEERIG